MKIETAVLVKGSETPVGDGLNDAVRCVLSLANGARRAAVLKRLPREKVLAECFCALLLKAWGLNVPDPFIVESGSELFFASADANYPSLKHRFGISNLPEGPIKDRLLSAACEIVANLIQTPLAVMADEAIDNRDRNLGNVLWDGASVAWIDHELCLGLGSHLNDTNKLALMVCATGNIESVKKSALAAWMSADRQVISHAESATYSVGFGNIVATRLNGLGAKILKRFPSPEDLLNQAQR